MKSSYIFSGFGLFKMLEGGRKKKQLMDLFIWAFSPSSKKFGEKKAHMYIQRESLKSLFKTIFNINGAKKWNL